ncbi:MAG: type IV toxin-antitoxin system AbiEi family antitoxin domain-containing protein [Xanthomonadales bacterium]|jgi:predicted transcriptional regulator of viral defense system|nr:type IV toxin-antitoxin system AbiEi family antitoxin domain-containing protein [Xanthomonadales bacterium]
MASQITQAERILELAEELGVLRPRDLDPYGISRTYLSRLCAAGKLQRIARGLYVLPDSEITEHHSLAEACKRVPKGVVCLLSALQYHDITTQAPFEVWLAIGEKAWRPRVEYPPLRIVHFSQPTLRAGIEEHRIEGVPVRVFTPEKTVADCFKYRNKIGLDVAIESLRECIRSQRCTMDDLWHYAKICRVQNIMRPYLESLAT